MKSKILTLLAAGSLALVGIASAQTPAAPKLNLPQASPPATLKQQVGITDIEINYNRPGMKGRKVFGGLVPYGQIWRTGANTATKITFSTPVKFGGADIPAGTYELFSIPGEKEWTLIVHKNMSQWGSYSYDQKNDVARVTAKAERLEQPVESFAFGFNDLRDDGATLNLMWEHTRVPVHIAVDTVGMLEPQIEAVMASNAEKKPYFGAAMFYYENNHNLAKALEWMNAAVAKSPGQNWMIYRKGLILEKMGDKAGAKAAAEESLAITLKGEPGELRDEYTRLNQALIDRVK
jgi:hypothetical protein